MRIRNTEFLAVGWRFFFRLCIIKVPVPGTGLGQWTLRPSDFNPPRMPLLRCGAQQQQRSLAKIHPFLHWALRADKDHYSMLHICYYGCCNYFIEIFHLFITSLRDILPYHWVWVEWQQRDCRDPPHQLLLPALPVPHSPEQGLL